MRALGKRNQVSQQGSAPSSPGVGTHAAAPSADEDSTAMCLFLGHPWVFVALFSESLSF